MDAPAESDSSGGRRKSQRKPRKLTSMLTPLRVGGEAEDLTIGLLSINKPFGVTNAPNWEREVCLDLIDSNDQFSMRILSEIHHENVLHLESVIGARPDDSSVVICVEKYTCSVYHLVSMLQIFNDFDLHTLQDVIRQVIEGIDELRLNNLYHGNLSIHNTYYDATVTAKLVKLANFKEKDDSQDLTEAQFGDWHAIGNMLEEVSTLQKERNANVNCSLIDDLARELKSLSPPKLLKQVKDDALNHVFFWGKSRRSSFFIYGTVGALHSSDFKSKVNKLLFIADDWNKDNQSLLLTTMNNYRTKHGGEEYKGGRYQYVLYVCGAYTHEEELEPRIDVDQTVNGESPLLCLELVKIVRELGYKV